VDQREWQGKQGLCVGSRILLVDCIKLHKLTVFPADAAEKQRYYMQQTIKKPRQVTVRQFVSCMGVLNDYLAYLPTSLILQRLLKAPRK
jgi:hypothetical protein